MGAAVLRQRSLSPLGAMLAEQPQLKADLSAFLVRTTGADLTRLEGIVAWAVEIKGEEGTVAVLMRLDGKVTPRGKPEGQHLGVQLVRVEKHLLGAAVPAGFVVGTRAGVQLAIALSQGKAKALEPKAPLAGMLAADTPAVDVLLGAAAAGIPEEAAKKTLDGWGIRTATATWDQQQRLKLALSGEGTKLSATLKMVMGLAQVMLGKLQQEKSQAMAGDKVLEGVSAIWAYHNFNKLLKDINPQVKGDQLTASYHLPLSGDPQMMAAVIGILAAVAIPSFIKYTRRSKTVEATASLDGIRTGAVQYFMADHYSKQGKLLPKKFPPSSGGWWPAKPCCEMPDYKCPLVPGSWDRSPWNELNFMLPAPHYYQYRFTSAGQGKDATYTAQARGDLDCDGIYSSYEIRGRVGPGGDLEYVGPIIQNEVE